MNKVIVLIVFALVACDPKYKNTGTIPETPVNLVDINSEHDDYNSDLPISHGESFPLYFSSNRNSTFGLNFNIINKAFIIKYTPETGRLFVGEDPDSFRNPPDPGISNALNKLNTNYDELGPYIIDKVFSSKPGWEYTRYIFLYSSNEGGNQDIKFLHNLDDESYSNPQSVSFLNSPQDDAYPCVTADSSAMYFCSNRKGKFKIFKAGLNKNVSVLQNLEDTSPKDIVEVTSLSSSADDKCPLIVNDVIVFVSNRAGGFGGFDLYYSILKNGEWSAPVNFGDKINSEYDEYRPFIKPMGKDFDNDFMIFSSNRPGGKGGFDLYYVGVPKSEQFQ